ncbi:molybdopterin molybdotransferase MoeA [Streptomyces sp. G-G2]|uniref:molybdopterin molybdotransferase MoeA n=1 Tax=Streptomyces sp. G-G2 TaxID=3046201 RepID=UPI0024B8F8A4|nr:molybdopterin molybdotransferase MoeA [Streptomyces sp. G-G2]MDJ0381085.1 molybdopterin molybdotransferase MoeA [Streptomyces sp. G-G2]
MTAPAAPAPASAPAAPVPGAGPGGPCRGGAPWQRARELAHAAAEPVPSTAVPLAASVGLVLAGAVRTRLPLPARDTAAMDGYAVAGPGPWRVRGAVRAGEVWPGGPLVAGEAVEISTGAGVPPGAYAVLPVEEAARCGPVLRGPAPAAGRHVRRTGEDAPAGTALAPAGSRVGPALLGLAAACGYDVLPVRRRPRVRILVTGDELALSGLAGPGRVRDALGPLLPPLVRAAGGEAADVRHVPDRPADALADQVHGAPAGADVIVVTGSTSVGATDRLRRLLHDDGARWVVDTVACRPGHPQLLARTVSGRWVVGLPGNPYAALVAAHTLLTPLLAGLSGRALPVLPAAPLTGPVHPAPGRTRLVPVVWEGATARALGGHGAAFLHGAALADALAAVPADWTRGRAVPLVPLS